ncbi:SDR family NAD(P)-dependent oxidoreductase [Corynebacterium tapiri]|uniref:SDR family NAD(P)-dependent oxidoreductase n=1 Tax=Corynebacterium tapiri TaxID=1448266 RepID=A0A5C4U3M0_9CORY|nr:SDR family NAD(P)-dependent oxidoreductase [Corynebacterium tapiri]TNL96782.1 SDR family NAD(P)-dependent oxidoreductase [Corynebacterium tapiri]
MTKVAVITGASSGIGAAAARALAGDGFQVILGARRLSKLQEVAQECGENAQALELDVTDDVSVKAFVEQIKRCDVLVNNAGGAKGLDPLTETTIEQWEWMYQTNVLGTVRMTQALLPKLRASGDGLIINLGSKAALDPYVGGSGYNAAKFGLKALTRVTRLEEIEAGHPVRVTEIDPGRVATDFSLVRFDGDEQRAAAVYADKLNLTAEDVAEAIRWVASLPAHMNVDTMNLMPRDQA